MAALVFLVAVALRFFSPNMGFALFHSFVTPVFLDEQSDAEVLLRNFMRYWRMAERGSDLVMPSDLPRSLQSLK